ncbi:hypothetical protein [Anaerosporobacter faecicola]|uniref:hypothetical protein n=1 Tax=Anaerosporobacter faecicola TaxID=2718714 RepID=UPI00143A7B83|nr:hypothetical protein [Anaerosporobacter faecicola]
MRKNSTMQWLEEVQAGEDLVNKHGAKLTIEYIESLQQEIAKLQDQIVLRDEFLKRLKKKNAKID